MGGVSTMPPNPPARGGSISCCSEEAPRRVRWGWDPAPSPHGCLWRSPDVEVQQDLLLVGAGVGPDPQDAERLRGGSGEREVWGGVGGPHPGAALPSHPCPPW